MATIRKRSRKRDAILACVRATTCHPSAEWMDINLEDGFLQNVHDTAGGAITDYRLSFYGLCPECMQAESSAE